MRPVGNTPGPDEPHHVGSDTDEAAAATRPHGATPPGQPQEVHGAETPNGSAADVISAFTDSQPASPTKIISYGMKPGGQMRIITDTDIPKGASPGKVDESGSKDKFRVDEEIPIAKKLASEGYHVTKLPEGDGKTRPADALLSGNGLAQPKRVEFKAMRPKPGQISDGNTIRNQVSHSIDKEGQARHMILDGRGSGLTKEEAILGIKKIVPRGKLDSVRVIGDGFDLTAEFPRPNGKAS